MTGCPAPDCDYEGAPRSVASHFSGKRDDDHAGGFETAKQQLVEKGEWLIEDGEGSDEEAAASDQGGETKPAEATASDPPEPGPEESPEGGSNEGGEETKPVTDGGLGLSGPPETKPESTASPEDAEEGEESTDGGSDGQGAEWLSFAMVGLLGLAALVARNSSTDNSSQQPEFDIV